MHLNKFAEGLAPLDMTGTDEFRSLLLSASDLGIARGPTRAYRSCNVVLRHLRFHYLEWGSDEDPPLLLLHGGHQSAHSWDLVSLALADRFHVFALDQRGHGDSEWARDKEYGIDSMAADAAAFLEHHGLERPIVMGHSMGGLVTMALVKSRLDLQAAVLVDVGPEINTDGVAMIRDFVERSAEFTDLDQFVSQVKAYDPFRSQEHIERTIRYNLFQRSDGRYVSKCDHMRGRQERGAMPMIPVTLEEARNFQVPVLVVRGEYSNVLSVDAADRFAAAIPRGQVVTVAACGHNVHSQNTKGFLDAVTPFLLDASKSRRDMD